MSGASAACDTSFAAAAALAATATWPESSRVNFQLVQLLLQQAHLLQIASPHRVAKLDRNGPEGEAQVSSVAICALAHLMASCSI